MFLEDLGLEEAGVAKLIRQVYALLDLQTYFTAGEKEVRAWTFRRGYTAPQAAGVIHTDFQKGFIRAEVMKYDDFVALGSEFAKDAGKLSVEGKEYPVQMGTSCTSDSTYDTHRQQHQLVHGAILVLVACGTDKPVKEVPSEVASKMVVRSC